MRKEKLNRIHGLLCRGGPRSHYIVMKASSGVYPAGDWLCHCWLLRSVRGHSVAALLLAPRHHTHHACVPPAQPARRASRHSTTTRCHSLQIAEKH